MKLFTATVIITLLTEVAVTTNAFFPSTDKKGWIVKESSFQNRPWRHAMVLSQSSTTLDYEQTTATSEVEESEVLDNSNKIKIGRGEIKSISAPLKFVGPYPCLALRFPMLATSSQRKKDISGISLDFVLDTASNTNTIQEAVAKELALEQVGEAPSGVGANGAIMGGNVYHLGTCELDSVIKEDQENVSLDGMMTEKHHNHQEKQEQTHEKKEGDKKLNGDSLTFMTGLTASSLPVASPASAGLLGVYFFDSFPGGVEFSWRGSSHGDEKDGPSITFYHNDNDDDDTALKSDIFQRMVSVPLNRLGQSGLPTVLLRINGFDIPALLDTGSPITVINAEAAKAAGIDTVQIGADDNNNRGWNPFGQFAKQLDMAKAASAGDILIMGGGANGEMIQLVRSNDEASISLAGENFDNPMEDNGGSGCDCVDFGSSRVYVGNLPGLMALQEVETKDGQVKPAAILGMDVLTRRSKMFYQSQKVYF